MIELPQDMEDHLREKAFRNGVGVADYLRQMIGEPISSGDSHELTGDADRPRESDPAYLLSLPKAERDRIMEAQAAQAAPLYEADLALPVVERELTAF